MTFSTRAACAALLTLLLAGANAAPLAAAEPLKIGMITTLSTAGGYLGEDVRDGFKLAMDEEGGKLGGVPVELVVEDDNLKPATGKQIADKFLLQDKIKLFTGIIYTNVALAVVPQLLENNAFYISPNSGPSLYAGKGCNKNFFAASWQTDNLFEAPGHYATTLGLKRVALLAPNYQGGKDAITGFKRYYRGEIAEEIYTTLDQTDYSTELARLRASNADGLFYFLPGGLGIDFLKQFSRAGLKDKLRVVLPEVSLESRVVAATGNDALGLYGTAHWVAGLPFPANKKFVSGFRAKYHREPTPYASQGYDTAKLIASGLRAVNGDLGKGDAFRAALKKADFASTRGGFRFNNNQFPIQDWYSTRVVKGKDGKLEIVTVGRILKDLKDVYAAQCPMT
jgi:branched-chain amino acid transport system substrate-binding protein